VQPEFAVMDLPAGRTGHISATDVDGRANDAYIYSDAKVWIRMECWSFNPPDDRWLSIAETFEFLPDPATAGVLGHFRHAELVRIEGAAHWLQHDKPEEVLKALNGFLAAAAEPALSAGG
jgi:pimeloyl-ACP methyl ester carboxylesterase